jgi:N-acetylmuramoyl-L-alanine amidase
MPFTGTAIKNGILTLLLALTVTNAKANIETIIDLVNDPAANNLEIARTRAAEQAVGNGSTLGYHSTAVDDFKTFSGTYTPPELPDNIKGQYIFKLAIFSDDGCNVTVDDKLVHSRYKKGQALPKLSQSFHPINVDLTPGKSVNLKVEYSNTYYKTAPNAPDIDGCTLFAYLERVIPFKIVELAPKIKDEGGNDIPGSEKPNIGLPLTPFVEEDPHTNRIAHREIKLKFDDAYSGKKITWSLTERPGATPAAIRGEWSDSATHKDHFEKSVAYGDNSFKKVSQSTLVAEDGHTAIRMNIPPIGFNQSRIKIQIEGFEEPFDLIDMEVPAVVVIDPGHGDGPSIPSSNVIGGEGDDTGEYEYVFALDLSKRSRDAIRSHKQYSERNIKVFLTREGTTNISAPARTAVARNNGCDVYVSVHFNDSTSREHRDSFGMWDLTGNLNLPLPQNLWVESGI